MTVHRAFYRTKGRENDTGGTFNRKTWNNASSLLLTISPIRYPGPANFLSVLSFHSTDERCNFQSYRSSETSMPAIIRHYSNAREKRREVANLINSLRRIQHFFFLSRKKWKSFLQKWKSPPCRFE